MENKETKYRAVGAGFNAVQITDEMFNDHSLFPEWLRACANFYVPPQGDHRKFGMLEDNGYFHTGDYLFMNPETQLLNVLAAKRFEGKYTPVQ